jgi:hypothetical protein
MLIAADFVWTELLRIDRFCTDRRAGRGLAQAAFAPRGARIELRIESQTKV